MNKSADANKEWNSFLQFCSKHARADKWFRGVTDTSYELLPRIGRPHKTISWRWDETTTFKGRTVNLVNRERRVFNAFRRRARLGLQFLPQTEFEWLALAQHHGVPTRLLDWTANPLMAAWFAVNSIRPTTKNSARVYVVKVSSGQSADENLVDPFDPKISSPIFVNPPHWHGRIRAQRGCFSIHPEPNKPFEPSGLQYFDIGQEHWQDFRRRLYYFGIDASTVLADLAGLGEALAWQYENQVGIGQVGY